MPTRADGAARSEFERAVRYGTLRAPPTTTPPKPAEATLGFSSTRKTIDTSPGWRYSSDQKKRLFKFPIRIRESSNVLVGPGEIDLVKPYEIHTEITVGERTVAVIIRSQKGGELEFLRQSLQP